MTSDFTKGAYVRLRDTPTTAGMVEDVRSLGGRTIVVVRLPTEVKKFPASQLELVPKTPETPADLIRLGKFSPPRTLRQRIAHVRMSGNMNDLFYSMESSDTDFYAHQFKPVVKLLDSPTGNLLIADEVGLGKTIEAGLVWMELAARYKYNRLVVVCPKVLQEKWRDELRGKFGIDAKICTPAELKDALATPFSQRAGFALVCSMQGIRPRPKAKRTGRPTDELADFLEEEAGGARRIDLLVIDEAHHMRNPGTQTNALGGMITAVAEHTVMLTATPINLRDTDLHSLLRLVDPMTFRDESALRDIIRANGPLVEARDSVLAGRSLSEISELLDSAARSPVLRNAKSLKKLRDDLGSGIDLTPANRADIARRLERVNQLSNAINRTRRRDVEDFRVERQVTAYRARMTEEEREVYDRVTRMIIEFSMERDMPTGFLTVMPQRMLASCLPAALEHWARKAALASEDEEYSDFENEADEDDMPLRELLERTVRTLPLASELAAQDTKFDEFLRVLRDRISAAPNEKIVVFSTFRATISYLCRRLEQAGIGVLTVHGATEDRQNVVKDFEKDPGVMVLIASEVASEGIDLQFARTVVNYDLPWNPMRIEQRIGRIDRLGQEADAISVLNLMHENTIDERIYHRLHERLKLCETALGGFEEILGKEIRELTSELFDGALSSEAQERRLAQTEQAIATRRQEEETLEREAAALFAHGDYIVNSIKESQSGGAWVTERDTADYLEFALDLLHPDREITWRQEEGLIDLRLGPSARQDFEAWCGKNRLNAGQIIRPNATVTFRVGQKSKQRRHPRLGPSHPLIRYLSETLQEGGHLSPSAVALELDAADACGLRPGVYAGRLDEWSFGSGAASTAISYALIDLSNGTVLPSDLAESVTASCFTHGRMWQAADIEINVSDAADLIEGPLDDDQQSRFLDERDNRQVEIDDRIAIQLASLEDRAKREREKHEQRIVSAGPRLEAANRALLQRFEDQVVLRRKQIEAQKLDEPFSQDVSSYVLKIVP